MNKDDIIKFLINALKTTEYDMCSICKNYIECKKERCDCYISGTGARDHTGNDYPDFKWSCMDFNFGECTKLEDTPCHDCVSGWLGFELGDIGKEINN
jgi:hypothetical protein